MIVTLGRFDLLRKRVKRESTGLFDAPDRRDEDDTIGVLGGPTGDGRLLGGPSHSSRLFDAPDRAPGEVPTLFDKPHRPADVSSSDKPARAARGGLFDKPAPRRK